MTEWILELTAVYAIGFGGEIPPGKYSFPMPSEAVCLQVAEEVLTIYEGSKFQIASCIPAPSEGE